STSRGSCDQPCMKLYFPVQLGGQPRRVSHHQEGAAGSLDQIAREREHVVRCRFVEIAGGLVSKQEQRPCRQGSADCDALLLAARQLLGITFEQTAEPEPLHQFAMPGRIVTAGNARLKYRLSSTFRLGIRLYC